MPVNEVLETLKASRELMNAIDQQLMEDMGKRWLGIEFRTKEEMLALSQKMTDMVAKGEDPTRGMIQKEERYQLLIQQMDDEITRYNGTVEGMITQTQREAATLGINSAGEAILQSYDDPLSATFNRINIDAVEAMIGVMGDGSPIMDSLEQNFGDAAQGMTDALLQGLIEGKGAAETARDMADGSGAGLDRSLTLARTEINRAYRNGATQQYQDSGVCKGFKRLAARDEACIACLILDGEVFDDLEQALDDHPNGRCTAVPIVEGLPEPQWETGKEWLANQSEEKQLEILGPARMELFQQGVPLDAFAGKTEPNEWGTYPTVVKLDDLISTLEVRDWTPEQRAASGERFRLAREAKKAREEGLAAVGITVEPAKVEKQIEVALEVKPVSAAINIKGQSLVEARQEALALIDSVHSDGNLNRISSNVVPTLGDRVGGEFRYLRDKTAKQIVLSLQSEHPELHFIHEVGHFIDLAGLPGKGFTSNKALAADVISAAKDSTAVQTILSRAVRNPEWAKYATSNEELFARSYAQYIAEKSGNPSLLRSIEKNTIKFRTLPQQWTTEDFAPIREAMDRLFEKQGWLK